MIMTAVQRTQNELQLARRTRQQQQVRDPSSRTEILNYQRSKNTVKRCRELTVEGNYRHLNIWMMASPYVD